MALDDLEKSPKSRQLLTPSQHIEEFLGHYEKDGREIYREALSLMVAEGRRSIVVDYDDIAKFDPDLAKDVMIDPTTTLAKFKTAAREVIKTEYPTFLGTGAAKEIKIRIINTGNLVPIRSIGVSLLGKIFSTAGVVVRVSERKNLVTTAAFTDSYGHVTFVQQDDEILKLPEHCDVDNCRANTFDFEKERSTFSDYQKIRIQELGDDLPPGQLPRGYDIILIDDLIDSARPGDHVVVTGMLKPVHEKIVGSSKSRVFASEIECNSIEIRDKSSEPTQLSNADKDNIIRIAKSPDAYGQLIASVAPAILGYEHIKEAVLLQLAGGTPMSFPDGTKRRGDIHILIVGDPGVSKSEILSFASKAAVRGVLATGKGSSAAGLSAGIVKQGDTAYLEVGVLPLADQGFAVIDELDKMRSEDRGALHEGMEQQTITINKAGFHMTLNTRASILAALNPIAGTYDMSMGLMENIKLPPALVSRFDLVTILIDRPRAESDIAIARHILAEHEKGTYEIQPPIPLPLLKKYIAYAKTNIKPKLTRAASAKLEEYYIKLRKETEPNQIPITARTLESLIRLATARAKILLRDEITEEDAEVAVSLMGRMFNEVLTDPNTKKADFGLLVGVSSKSASQTTTAQRVVKELALGGGTFDRSDLKAGMIKLGLDDEVAERMIHWLYSNGRIYEVKPGVFKPVGAFV
jgi:replicative DNA helicase Mcm